MTGSHVRVAGRLAGPSVEFEVIVLDASVEKRGLVAQGPISVAVEYLLRSGHAGSDARASVSVERRGLLGRRWRSLSPPRQLSVA